MSRAVAEVADWSVSSTAIHRLSRTRSAHRSQSANRPSLRDISAIITYLAEDLFCSGERMHPLPARMPSMSTIFCFWGGGGGWGLEDGGCSHVLHVYAAAASAVIWRVGNKREGLH